MQNMMVAPMPVGTPGRSLFGSKRRKVVPARDDGTMAHRGMPMIESAKGTAMHEGGGMPGPISGFGGGTFNMDGSQATPMDGGPASTGGPMRSPPPLGAGQQAGPLGGSMRQPFDYEAARAALVGDAPQVKDWQKVLAVLADGVASYQGRTPTAIQGIAERQADFEDRRRHAAEQLMKWQYQDYARQSEADLRAANPFTIGRERLAYDPATGETNVQYRGRQDAEIYADTLGFDRGSEEWGAAVEDYVLRSSGPSAHKRDMEIDDHRTGNDRMLESYRQRNRMEMEGARQSNRRGMVDYRNSNPAPARGGSRRAARPTATDASGNRVEWDGKAWVPAK